jgi:hypothetical protein
MKNTIKLIAAGAVAIAAFATTSSAQAQEVAYGEKGSQSFVGTLKVTPGKYVEVSGISNTVSETINPVTIAGTTITQGNSTAASVSATTPFKVTNKSVLESIYGNATNAKGATLVWIVQGPDKFAQGSLAGLKTVKSGKSLIYTVTPASGSVFDTDPMSAELVISKRTPAYKTINKVKTLSSITTVSSAGIYDVLFDDISVSGVGTVTEVDSNYADQTSPISVTVTIPLSGTLLTE